MHPHCSIASENASPFVSCSLLVSRLSPPTPLRLSVTGLAVRDLSCALRLPSGPAHNGRLSLNVTICLDCLCLCVYLTTLAIATARAFRIATATNASASRSPTLFLSVSQKSPTTSELRPYFDLLGLSSIFAVRLPWPELTICVLRSAFCALNSQPHLGVQTSQGYQYQISTTTLRVSTAHDTPHSGCQRTLKPPATMRPASIVRLDPMSTSSRAQCPLASR